MIEVVKNIVKEPLTEKSHERGELIQVIHALIEI
jgi:hypothetical protein